MFFAVKCESLKIVRTVPKMWISKVDGVAHCWIPKYGYSYKLKNLAQPPMETDVKGRSEWNFTECEMLFNKEFLRINDGEMALSKLVLGPEWFYNGADTRAVIFEVAMSPELKIPSSEPSIPGPKTLSENCAGVELPVIEEVPLSTVTLSTEHKDPSSEPKISSPQILSENWTGEKLPVIEEVPLSTEHKNVSSESEIPVLKILSGIEKYQDNKRLCKEHHFKPPIYFKKFEQMVWRYVRTFSANDLKPDSRFLTLEEVSSIPRKHEKPFCHPGPEKRCEFYDWYLADSIIQQIYLKGDSLPSYVVRWVGYEDE